MSNVSAFAISCFWYIYFTVVLFAALVVTSTQACIHRLCSCICCAEKDYVVPTEQSEENGVEVTV